MTNVDPAILRQLIDYNPATGELVWRARDHSWFPNGRGCESWNKSFAGKPAFSCLNQDGYGGGKVLDKRHLAHRVAWAIHYGSWPEGQIDHINQMRFDNRIANLRSVSVGENRKNQSMHSRNTSGRAGVSWNKAGKVWHAQIGHNGKQIHLGLFRDLADAVRARDEAEIKLGFGPNHGRPRAEYYPLKPSRRAKSNQLLSGLVS